MSMGGNMMLSILVTTIGVLQGSLALSFERQLTGELLENYCSSARPVKNDSDTVELKLGLTLQQILDVDTNVQTMTGLYWLNLEWRDEYLVWDKEKYGVWEGFKKKVKLRLLAEPPLTPPPLLTW